MSFLTDYFALIEGTGEHAVLCPFTHVTESGTSYKESHPSAHVNTDTHVFHCKVCDKGLNDLQFIQEITGCPAGSAFTLQKIFNTQEDKQDWLQSTTLSEETKATIEQLGISEKVRNELHLATPPRKDGTIAYPVFMYDHLCDVRIYNPKGKPKVTSRLGETTGLIIPFDLWVDTPITKTTLICAGEKDMAIARTLGFNAITLTGGERSKPKLLEYFRDRSVAIVYDNDIAGIQGAEVLANILYRYTKKVKVVTSFHQVCKETGEDIHDYFMKYGKTKADLIDCIKNTAWYKPRKDLNEYNQPLVDLYTASREFINKTVQSNIQVIAVSEVAFSCPTLVTAEKTKLADDTPNNMVVGELKTWELSEETCKDIMHVIDGKFNEQQIFDNMKKYLLKIFGERNANPRVRSTTTVYKATVTDLYETADDSTQPMEYTAYSLAGKLESGKKYHITYKLIPHPYKGQQLIMIILSAEQAADSVANFSLDSTAKKNLKTFIDLPGTVEEKINLLAEKAKGVIGYDGINKLITAIDLAYHTVLSYNFGHSKKVRGYLDALIIGESRTGKSSTADALRKLYGLGTFTSLAGNSATIAGLIGGSSKSAGGTMQTRAGVIPQNHKGLIIFEEFGKCSKDILKELTDIRSSNEVRIARVTGTMTLPALVRMISLTNVKSNGSAIKSIASYPNGISVITELVNTAEDIARYDFILLLSDTGNMSIDPTWEPEQPLDTEAYKTRIRWIWSRTAEQIIIDKNLEKYIVVECNKLNERYNCHIKLFGPEAWKKVSRLAIAVAGYLVSTDSTYERIIVTKEHIDYAIKFLIDLYDNNTFKLAQYVENEKRYMTVDIEAIGSLQNIYNKYPGLVLQLENSANITKSMLENTTGLDSTELKNGLQLLTRAYFIKVDKTEIIPTERFRKTVNQIDRHTQIGRIGEKNVTIPVEPSNN